MDGTNRIVNGDDAIQGQFPYQVCSISNQGLLYWWTEQSILSIGGGLLTLIMLHKLNCLEQIEIIKWSFFIEPGA